MEWTLRELRCKMKTNKTKALSVCKNARNWELWLQNDNVRSMIQVADIQHGNSAVVFFTAMFKCVAHFTILLHALQIERWNQAISKAIKSPKGSVPARKSSLFRLWRQLIPKMMCEVYTKRKECLSLQTVPVHFLSTNHRLIMAMKCSLLDLRGAMAHGP